MSFSESKANKHFQKIQTTFEIGISKVHIC